MNTQSPWCQLGDSQLKRKLDFRKWWSHNKFSLVHIYSIFALSQNLRASWKHCAIDVTFSELDLYLVKKCALCILNTNSKNKNTTIRFHLYIRSYDQIGYLVNSNLILNSDDNKSWIKKHTIPLENSQMKRKHRNIIANKNQFDILFGTIRTYSSNAGD